VDPVTKLFNSYASPSQDSIVTAGGDGWLKIWNANELNLLGSADTKRGRPYGFGISPLGNLVATGHKNGVVVVFNVNLAQNIFENPRYLAHDNKSDRYVIRALTFSNNGKWLATGPMSIGCYGDGEEIFIWDTNTFNVLHRIKHDVNFFRTTCIAFAPDDSYFWINAFKMFSTSSWTLVKRFNEPFCDHAVTILPNNNVMGSGPDGTIYIIDGNLGGDKGERSKVVNENEYVTGSALDVDHKGENIAFAMGDNFTGPFNIFNVQSFFNTGTHPKLVLKTPRYYAWGYKLEYEPNDKFFVTGCPFRPEVFHFKNNAWVSMNYKEKSSYSNFDISPDCTKIITAGKDIKI